MEKDAERRSTAGILVVVLAGAVVSFTAASEEEQAVRVGVYDNRPKVFTDENGTPQGFFVDIIRHIAEREGWRLEFVEGTWREDLERLREGSIDLMPDVAYSEERSELYEFGNIPVLADWLQVFCGHGAECESVLDLSGKRVVVLSDSVQEEVIPGYLRRFDMECEVVSVDTYEDALEAVERGRADVVVLNRFYSVDIKRWKDIGKTNVIFHPTLLYFAAARGRRELLKVVDRHLEEMKENRDSVYYSALYQWIKPPGETRAPGWLITVLAAAAALLAGALVLSFLLKWQVSRRTKHLREARGALSASEQQYRTLLSNLDDIVYMVDREGRISYVSRQVSKYGYQPEELISRNLAGVIHPEDAERVMKVAAEQMESGRESPDETSAEFRIVAADGQTRWVEERGHLVYDRKGAAVGISGVLRDITERKELEEQFLQAQKMEAVGRLAGGIAHDFNNLLTVILGYCDILSRKCGPDTPEGKRVESIRASGKKASALVRQLLAFSRRQVLQPRPVNVNQVVSGMDDMLRGIIGEDIRFSTSLSGDVGAIMADPGQIEQILMNLAVNARDAMPGGGDLTIRTESVFLDEDYVRQHAGAETGPHVVITISDTGQGMDGETLERIFEPFFTTKEQGKGTGLGLSTVYGIVKQSGGDIWAYSEPGAGTTFKIYFPRVDEEAEVLRHEPPGFTPPGGTGTVLVVEDDVQVRELVRDALSQAGYKVLEAGSGDEALSLCEDHEGSIDILLTDVVLPGMACREMADRFHKMYPQAKILFMSGYTDDTVVHRGVLDEGTAFIEKPFTPDGLLRKIHQVLHSEKAEEE